MFSNKKQIEIDRASNELMNLLLESTVEGEDRDEIVLQFCILEDACVKVLGTIIANSIHQDKATLESCVEKFKHKLTSSCRQTLKAIAEGNIVKTEFPEAKPKKDGDVIDFPKGH